MTHWHKKHAQTLTVGARIADAVAAWMGSWSFILGQTTFLFLWIAWNSYPGLWHFDPEPFIGLNLFLSFEAAYAAPFIMISQNRQSDRDRHQAEEDYRTNIEAEKRIEALQLHLARIENEKLDILMAEHRLQNEKIDKLMKVMGPKKQRKH